MEKIGKRGLVYLHSRHELAINTTRRQEWLQKYINHEFWTWRCDGNLYWIPMYVCMHACFYQFTVCCGGAHFLSFTPDTLLNVRSESFHCTTHCTKLGLVSMLNCIFGVYVCVCVCVFILRELIDGVPLSSVDCHAFSDRNWTGLLSEYCTSSRLPETIGT